MLNHIKEITDTLATLEDYPAQRDADASAKIMRGMIEAIIPALMADASAEEIAIEMCKACPKFGG